MSPRVGHDPRPHVANVIARNRERVARELAGDGRTLELLLCYAVVHDEGRGRFKSMAMAPAGQYDAIPTADRQAIADAMRVAADNLAPPRPQE